jgi:tRNA (uracil-5-)-methyltransferase TRM9
MKWAELDTIIKDVYNSGYTSILDIGCGNGRLLEQLKSTENSVWNISYYLGIDSSSWMIEEARKLHGEHHFELCDMLSIQSLNHTGTFDAIILLASFHHLETREARIQVLWDIQKFLSPNGSVYMTNWNLREQLRYEKSHRGNGDFDIKIGEFSRYYHGFTPDELSELFWETGWSIIENRIFEWKRNIYSKIRKN